MVANAQALFTLYNDLMIENGLDPMPDRWFRSSAESFQRLGAYCADRGFDPERWIRAKHAATGWRFRIGPKKLAHATAAFIAKYRDFGNQIQGEAQHQAQMVGAAEADTPWTSELIVLAEAAKRTYWMDKEACRTFAPTFTGGYHPESKFCNGCPEAQACWDALPEVVRRARARR